MDTFIKAIGAIVVGVGLIFGLALLFAYPTMWVVNYLFTPAVLTFLFGIPSLTVWKAFLLNFICAQLFKGSTTTSSSKK